MTILIALGLSLLLTWYGGAFIKRKASLFYIASALASLSVITLTWTGASAHFPAWFAEWVWPLLSRGALATALFIIVMVTGALPNGSAAIKRLIPVRAELSIMASILILGHNVAYGKTYFVRLFTDASSMPVSQLLAAVCSLALIAIMLPLAITSFKSVRKKMKPKAWKQLQRSAYIFYALIYLHVMLLYVPLVQRGMSGYLPNVIIYSIIFIGYAAFRIRKALARKNADKRWILPAASLLCAAVCIACGVPWVAPASPDLTAQTGDVPAAVRYTDGTHFGTGKGYNGDVTVAVRIADGQITGVTVVATQDDTAYWEKAASLIDVIIAEQSAEVDGVSGATYSSAGLKEAVANALNSAVIAQ